MSKNKYKIGEELFAIPLITGRATTFRIVAITNTTMGKVYRAIDVANEHEYVTRPLMDDDTKFWDADNSHSCYVYRVRPSKRKK